MKPFFLDGTQVTWREIDPSTGQIEDWRAAWGRVAASSVKFLHDDGEPYKLFDFRVRLEVDVDRLPLDSGLGPLHVQVFGQLFDLLILLSPHFSVPLALVTLPRSGPGCPKVRVKLVCSQGDSLAIDDVPSGLPVRIVDLVKSEFGKGFGFALRSSRRRMNPRRARRSLIAAHIHGGELVFHVDWDRFEEGQLRRGR